MSTIGVLAISKGNSPYLRGRSLPEQEFEFYHYSNVEFLPCDSLGFGSNISSSSSSESTSQSAWALFESPYSCKIGNQYDILMYKKTTYYNFCPFESYCNIFGKSLCSSLCGHFFLQYSIFYQG